jgi:hypothetical protein
MIKTGEFDGLYCHRTERGRRARYPVKGAKEQRNAVLIHFRGDQTRHWRIRIDMAN